MSYNPTPDDYHAPIQAPPSHGIEWLPRLPFVNGGPHYVDESDPSWEEVVAMVVIPGHPGAIRDASGAWEVLFSRVEQAKSMVDQLSTNLQTWEGTAGETFRGHLDLVSRSMNTLVETHRPVVQQLNSAADNLQTALERTPVPDDMVDDVLRARENYAATGNISSSYKPGFFYDVLFPIFHNRWLAEVGSFLTFGFTDWVARKLRNWLTDEDDKAKAAYRQLAGQHVSTMDSMPQAASMLPSDLQAALVTPGLPPGAATPSGVPGAGGFGGMPGGAGGGPSLSTEDWTSDPSGYGGTTLAGATGPTLGGVGSVPGLGGLGPGAGGLPGTGPSGLGGGSGFGGSATMPGSSSAASMRGGAIGLPFGAMAGAGGGAGGGTRSPGRSFGGGMAGLGGVAGGAGAGARGPGSGRAGGLGGVASRSSGGIAGAGVGAAGRGGAGAGTRGGGAVGRGGAGPGAVGRGSGAAGRSGVGGVVPAGTGAGDGGDGADHSTWLTEDEDVWGVDSDAAPPVLGG